MPRIHKSIDIEAAREHVFAEAADPQKQPEWAIFLKQVQVISGDGKSEGSSERWAFKVGPRVQQLQAAVSEYRLNESVARRVSGNLSLQERMTFTPAGQDITRVEWTFEYTPPMGVIGLILDFLLMNRVFQNDVEKSLENLKSKLEG